MQTDQNAVLLVRRGAFGDNDLARDSGQGCLGDFDRISSLQLLDEVRRLLRSGLGCPCFSAHHEGISVERDGFGDGNDAFDVHGAIAIYGCQVVRQRRLGPYLASPCEPAR
jgi:hypothetical protein